MSKILIVDDEKEIADLVEIYLKNENYNVLKYYSSKDILQDILSHNGEEIVPFFYARKRKEKPQVRFDDKCKTAERLGLIHKFVSAAGITIDLPSELIEIYSYRNGIHIIAEQRKGINYELALSKKAYCRMRPFIDQLKSKLAEDGKI